MCQLSSVSKVVQEEKAEHRARNLQEVVAEENRPHAHALVPEALASPPYKQPKK